MRSFSYYFWPLISALLVLSISVYSEQKQEGSEQIIAVAANRPDAQIMILKIPGPRGSILDRHGRALATSVVKQQVVVNFPSKGFKDDQAVLNWVQELRDSLPESLPQLKIKDSEILNHYEFRRWVPMAISNYLDNLKWTFEVIKWIISCL